MLVVTTIRLSKGFQAWKDMVHSVGDKMKEHNVPAVSGHIQSNWPQGRLQSLRPQDIHYAFGQQGCRRALAGSACRTFPYIHNTEVHRCEL